MSSRFHSILILEDTTLFKLQHKTPEKNLLAKIKLSPGKGTYIFEKIYYIKISSTFNIVKEKAYIGKND